MNDEPQGKGDPRRSPGAVKAAATELRDATHDLAGRAVAVAPEVESLRRAAALVREAAAILDGDRSAPWWEGPTRPDDDGLRHYRHRSLFQGELHPFSPALRWDDVDRPGPDGQPGRRFRVTLSELFAGPPGAVHGGYIAGLFDELLGATQALADRGGGYTGRLTVRYRSLTPLGEELVFNGWIVDDRSRRIETRATCHVGPRLCADAAGLFVRPARHVP